jgi:hypothetical protein
MRTAAYTSIYGGYDQLKPHPDAAIVDDWVCYTDDPTIGCAGWDVVVEPGRFEHPRLSAKWRKCHPPEAAASIWVDGSMQFTDPRYFDVVHELLERADMVMFAHPQRQSLLAEAYVSTQMLKYEGLPVLAQAEHYIDEWGWPDDTLWASTTIGRNHTQPVLEMGAAWFAENEHWTYQDQISLPPLIVRYGLTVAALPHSLWRNPWFTLTPHASHA